jgi:general L-amino acid transport system permease protein
MQRDLAIDSSAHKLQPPAPPEPMRPPRSEIGLVGWFRHNLFSSWSNTLLTLVALYITWRLVDGVISWGIVNAVWSGDGGEACRVEGSGACWAFVKAKFGQFVYGRYPESERWRVDLVFVMALAGLVPLMVPRIPYKAWSAGYTFFIFPVIAFWLLVGGTPTAGAGLLDALGLALAVVGIACFALAGSTHTRVPPQTLRLAGGFCLAVAFPLVVRWLLSTSGLVVLPTVPTELWGGLLVTLVVASVGITGSFPVGIALALGRRSRMPFVRWASVAFIEFVRGVPLITVLFMASVMLPLFLPAGVTFDKLLRALFGVALFAGAYMAETIRGGLQAIPRGQFEAAEALGLSYAQRMGLIILPQALKLVIPGIVNSFVGLFKDTSLVLIIGLFDLLGIVQLNLTDAKWFANSTAITGYVFAGLVFWLFCFGMSRYSQMIERRLALGERR